MSLALDIKLRANGSDNCLAKVSVMEKRENNAGHHYERVIETDSKESILDINMHEGRNRTIIVIDYEEKEEAESNSDN